MTSEPFWAYFDRVRIINLKERKDRRTSMTKEIRRIGGVFEGVRLGFFEAIRRSSADGFPSPGLNGCFHSHLQILRDAHASDCKRLLVLEDDVVFHPEFNYLSNKLVQQLEGMPDWKIVNIGWESRCTRFTQTAKGISIAPVDIIGTHAYCLKGTHIEEFMEWFEYSLKLPLGHPDGGRISPDGVLNHFRMKTDSRGCYIFNPKLAQQYNSNSSISGNSLRHKLLGNGLFRAIRRIVSPPNWG
jgi:glycosyl transferase family 25